MGLIIGLLVLWVVLAVIGFTVKSLFWLAIVGIILFVAGGPFRTVPAGNVGVKDFRGNPDPNHPILEMSVTRPYGMLGATWARNARSSLGGELFYAPGSVLTVRFLGAMHFGGLK